MYRSASLMLGQYRPLDSYLHRLDARAKLVPVVLVMVLGLLTSSPLFYISLLVALIAALLVSGISAGTLARNFRPILVLVAVTFLYHVLFSARQTEGLFQVWGFAVTKGGLAKATFFSLRLLLFVAVAFLVTLTNSPSELAEALTRLLRPLERLKVPVSDLGLIIFIALRFIPILYDELLAIRNAQMIRGVDFGGGMVSRIKKTTAILVPVLVGTIGRADELALAMEARGYQSGTRRSFYSHSRFGAQAWLFLALSSAAIAALFFMTR